MHDSQSSEYFECPHCGALVPVDAPACRACGSDAETGWSEDAGLGCDAEDDFDYDEFLRREFPEAADISSRQAVLRWVLVILVTVLCLGLLLIGMR